MVALEVAILITPLEAKLHNFVKMTIFLFSWYFYWHEQGHLLRMDICQVLPWIFPETSLKNQWGSRKYPGWLDKDCGRINEIVPSNVWTSILGVLTRQFLSDRVMQNSIFAVPRPSLYTPISQCRCKQTHTNQCGLPRTALYISAEYTSR